MRQVLPPNGEDGPGDLAWRFTLGYPGHEHEQINVNAQTREAWTGPPPPEP